MGVKQQKGYKNIETERNSATEHHMNDPDQCYKKNAGHSTSNNQVQDESSPLNTSHRYQSFGPFSSGAISRNSPTASTADGATGMWRKNSLATASASPRRLAWRRIRWRHSTVGMNSNSSSSSVRMGGVSILCKGETAISFSYPSRYAIAHALRGSVFTTRRGTFDIGIAQPSCRTHQ